MNIYSPTISGSLTISGSIITTGGGLPLTGSLISSGSFTSIGPTVISGSLSVITGSSIEFQVLDTGVKIGNLATDNHTITGSLLVSGSITTVGNITAQTLVVQTITSSVSFITGSTKFGSGSTDTHQFTGSLYITGSVGINAASSFRFNGVADTSHAVGYDSTVDGAFLRGQNGVRFLTGTGGGSARMTINSNGNVGIGVTPNLNWTNGIATEVGFSGNGIWSRYANEVHLTNNYYYSGSRTYASTNPASDYEQYNGNHTFYTAPLGTAGTAVTLTARMFISGSGNVGIGTASPEGILMVKKDTDGDTPIIFLNGSGGSGNTNASITLDFRLQNGTGGSTGGVKLKVGKETDHIGANVNDYFAISTTRSDAMAERMRITSGGLFKFQNNGSSYESGTAGVNEFNTAANDTNVVFRNTASSLTGDRAGVDVFYTTASPNNSSAAFYQAADNSSGRVLRFQVTSNGYVWSRSDTITLITSDKNLKKDIIDYDKGLFEVLAMKPRYYRYKAEPEKLQIGFIAQEMDEALKGSMVDSTEKNEETGENYKTYQVEWYPLLVKAIQELKSQNDALQSRIETLESK